MKRYITTVTFISFVLSFSLSNCTGKSEPETKESGPGYSNKTQQLQFGKSESSNQKKEMRPIETNNFSLHDLHRMLLGMNAINGPAEIGVSPINLGDIDEDDQVEHLVGIRHFDMKNRYNKIFRKFQSGLILVVDEDSIEVVSTWQFFLDYKYIFAQDVIGDKTKELFFLWLGTGDKTQRCFGEFEVFSKKNTGYQSYRLDEIFKYDIRKEPSYGCKEITDINAKKKLVTNTIDIKEVPPGLPQACITKVGERQLKYILDFEGLSFVRISETFYGRLPYYELPADEAQEVLTRDYGIKLKKPNEIQVTRNVSFPVK